LIRNLSVFPRSFFFFGFRFISFPWGFGKMNSHWANFLALYCLLFFPWTWRKLLPPRVSPNTIGVNVVYLPVTSVFLNPSACSFGSPTNEIFVSPLFSRARFLYA